LLTPLKGIDALSSSFGHEVSSLIVVPISLLDSNMSLQARIVLE
jgi:hypothetical protein